MKNTDTQKKKNISPATVILFVVLVLYAAFLLSIVLWAFSTAMKTDTDFTSYSNYMGLPRDDRTRKLLAPWAWQWKNFATAVRYLPVTGIYRGGRAVTVPFAMQVVYTLGYAVVCGLLSTICPCIMAYATSKFHYKFNKVIDTIVIITMIVPIVGSQVSMVSLLHKLHLYDTMWGLYMQKFSFAGMYYLVFASVFKGVSKEYYEAAHIDGASEWSVMVRVAMPLVLTSFGLVFLIFFIQYWNDYQTVLLYAPSHPTVAYGLYRMMTDAAGSSERGVTSVQMAGCILIVIPVIVLFIVFRNKLMGNLTMGGVKE